MKKYILKKEFIDYNSDGSTNKELYCEAIIREKGIGDFNMREMFTNFNDAFNKAVLWEVDKEHGLECLGNMDKKGGLFK